MMDNNLLAAYKLINCQLVNSNQKLKEEMRDKIEMINELNDQVFKYRAENKTLRDMVQKLLEQFKTITTIMISVRDQSESVFKVIHNEHAIEEAEQQMRRPIAGLYYEKRRAENPPYVDEAAITEEDDENQSEEDYRNSIISQEETVEQDGEENSLNDSLTTSISPLVKRLQQRKSRNRSIDESFETIDTQRVVKVARRSQDYLHDRLSREGIEDLCSVQEITDREETDLVESMDISQTLVPLPSIVIDGTTIQPNASLQSDEPSTSILEASSFAEQSGVPSDHSTQSDLNPVTDQSLRPQSMKRMASDSMLSTLIERTLNKENIITDDTISNATCSTPLAKSRRVRNRNNSSNNHPPVSPVVVLKPLTKANLSEHNISYDLIRVKDQPNESTVANTRELDNNSKAESLESSESRRPRRRAAPKQLKEPSCSQKLRRT
ncbi:uncharacterized protein LOC129756418 [Uranotaenia lowii]|uniref:uncharacterized protein LOC129756418 n=1 Tax=Uranotaenia lowii TaxID=190385 RepID=UPI00247A9EB5|nr:uncharacterized protein LOC129756418 [Uranotaenia lowii]